MKKILFLAAMLAAGAARGASDEPSWLNKTIIPQDEFIFSVGHSQAQKTEKDARDEALADATAHFVKYCGVSVEAFDRSVETYSKDGAKTKESSEVEARNVTRARAFVHRAVPDAWRVREEKKGFVAAVLLKVPKEEAERIMKEKDVKLALDVAPVYEDADGKIKPLDEGSVLRSGEGFAVYVKPSDGCYVYLYELDALGKSARLFPNADFKTAPNPLAPGEGLWIPNAKDLFALDETTGKEKLFLFASPDKILAFEGEDAATLTRKDLEGAIAFKKMGVAGLKPKREPTQTAPPKHGQDVVEIKRKLQAEGAFVYELSFWHK